jgi:DNA-binding MarR family transcriptional regulator
MSEADDTAIDILVRAGISEPAVAAVMEIDALLQNWRRRIIKRDVGHRAIADLGLDIDLAQLDVLSAIGAPRHEFGETGGEETMVATVAERLAIDPSRASRIVSEMVTAGYAVRVASQADARRTIIALTRAGQAIVEAVRIYRFLLMGDHLNGWDEKELEAFIPLLHRYSEWSSGTETATMRFESEIAALSATVAKELKRADRARKRVPADAE